VRSAALVASKPLRMSMPSPVAVEPATKQASQEPASDLDWPALAATLRLTGLARELALRSELVARTGDHVTLRVPVKALLEAGNEARVRAALSEHFGRPIRLTTQVGAVSGATAASRSESVRAARQKEAENAIYADPFVRELIENFGASVDPRSIRPSKPDA
jgi:DNA polymerase-3 subunit gamma/tau